MNSATLKLWDHLFGSERGALAVWSGERHGEDVDGARTKYFDYPAEAQDAAEYAGGESESGREAYFCTHLLTARKRKKVNAAAVRTLWGEFDGAEVPNGNLKPTALVESSPGHFHAYWRLTDTIPPETAEDLNKRIAAATDADPSGFDLSQLLRVPGTVNHKYQGLPVVRLLDINTEHEYVPADLDNSLPLIEEPSRNGTGETGASETDDEPPVALSPERLKVYRGEDPKLREDGTIDRSGSLMKIGRVLYDSGANRRVVMEALRERDRAVGWEKYTARPDAGERYTEIFDELEDSGRNTTFKMFTGGRDKSNEEPQEHPFPVMDEAAYRGVFGELVETIEPHTEADPVALLLSALTAFGSAYGRRGWVEISGTRHHGNLFVGIVGDTARSRKGTSWSPIKNIFGVAAPAWTQNRIVSGLSSGEGLIFAVRDEVEGEDKDGNTIVVDKGVRDKRLLVAEGELSQGLKVLRREGNTLSPILRNAWDSSDLATLTKNSPLRATEPHISVMGHITSPELRKHMVESEMANGFGNRYLLACVKRSKKLPFGGDLSSVDMGPIIRGLRSALDHRAGRMSFAQDARDTWAEMYESLTEDRPGMFGMITARAEAQTLRLAILYALAAGSSELRVEHLVSAYAVWGYCEDSALYLFGDQLGDVDADKLLDALRSAPDGMTRTEIRDLFGRNKKPEDLQRILDLLEHAGKAYATRETTGKGGRPPETWFAA